MVLRLQATGDDFCQANSQPAGGERAARRIQTDRLRQPTAAREAAALMGSRQEGDTQLST